MPFLLEAPDIPPLRLLLLLLPLAATAWAFRWFRLGLERRLLTGSLRAVVQLSVIGFVLAPLFGLGDSPWILLVLGVMCGLAAFFSLTVLGNQPGLRLWPIAVLAIVPVVIGLTLFALGFVIPDVPLLSGRYAISLAGMLAGNAMNGVALAGERFLAGLRERRGEVELALLHGATGREAVLPLMGAAIRAAVTPSLNALVSVGLVSIPGMMTGQIIAGGDPIVAARYQMMIMALWVASATLAPAIFLVQLGRRSVAHHRISGAPFRAGDRKAFRVRLAPVPVPEGPLSFDKRPDAGATTFADDDEP